MTGDPKGYYRVLGLSPKASAGAIKGAYRRQAKLLHPDVPRTGDAAQFLRLRAAYDVLGNRDRRAAYDSPSSLDALAEQVPDEFVVHPEPVRRWPRPPTAVWLGLAALSVAALAQAVVLLGAAKPHAPSGSATGTRLVQRRATATTGPSPDAAPPPPGVDADPGPSAGRAEPQGKLTDFVLPAPAEATLWRYDRDRHSYVPDGHLAPFTSVEMLRAIPDSAMTEIRAADGRVGFVEAARLAPGDPDAAHIANCTYNAGPPPRSGEVLRRGAAGSGRVRVDNRQDQSAVVQLRDGADGLVAEMFVGPRQGAIVDGVPPGVFVAQYASGEFWSRGCGIFTAAMRGLRSGSPVQVDDSASGPGPGAEIVLPAAAPVLDISNDAFSRR